MPGFFQKKLRRLLGLDALHALAISIRILLKEIKYKMVTATEILTTISDGLAAVKTGLDDLSSDMQKEIADLKTQIGRDMPQLDALAGIATVVGELGKQVKGIDDAVKAADPGAFATAAPAPTPTPVPGPSTATPSGAPPAAKQATGPIPATFPFAGVLSVEGVDTFEELHAAGDLTSITLPDPVGQSRTTVLDALAAADAAA